MTTVGSLGTNGLGSADLNDKIVTKLGGGDSSDCLDVVYLVVDFLLCFFFFGFRTLQNGDQQ